MEEEIYRVYKAVAKTTVQYPRTAKNKDRVPFWASCPDYPVCKSAKYSVSEVSINNGLHFGTICLDPPWSELPDHLDIHFQKYQTVYVRQGYERRDHPLMRVHAEPIFQTLETAGEYTLKSLLRRRTDPGEIFILPKAQSEFKNLPVDPRKLTGGGVF
jgi:hypothetical protein